MCAISGLLDYQNGAAGQEAVYERMLQTMKRRGPDQQGQYINGPAALLHRRLCVVDAENGRQPFLETRGKETFVLVYNGEIYNTPELREELRSLGHPFRGRSDTEVVLRSYMEWGDGCVSRLNGIFAFAVWEEKSSAFLLPGTGSA